jgi:putative transposase
MTKRRLYDAEGHAHFATFSCYHHRRLLDDDRAKEIVASRLAAELPAHCGICIGYVIMPDHVHVIVWFPERNRLSVFLKQWKQRSSVQVKQLFRRRLTHYASKIDVSQPVWQRKFYSFNLYSPQKLREKLAYMHANPVRAGLAKRAIDWRWSSARYYELQEPVDVPVRWVE